MFIRKKKYMELIKQKDEFEKIAFDTIQLNGRVIDNNERIIKELNDIQELNHSLQQQNEILVGYIKELEAKLDFAIKQRDYYYDLLENASEVESDLTSHQDYNAEENI